MQLWSRRVILVTRKIPTPQIIHLYALPVAFLFYFCGHLLQSQHCTPAMAFVLVLSLVVYTYSTLSTRHDSFKENTFGHENCFRISITNAFHWLFHRDFYPLPSFSLSLQFSSIFLLVESRICTICTKILSCHIALLVI